MRLVFAGTPQTAVPVFDALLASRHEVAAVVTRPDAPAGRGRKVEASPVAQRAPAAGLEGLTPARARDPAFLPRPGPQALGARAAGVGDGRARAVRPPAEGVRFAPKIAPDDGQVDWKLPAHVGGRQIRACPPDPGAWTELDGVRLKLGPIALNP